MLKIQIQYLDYYKNTKFPMENYRQDFCNPLLGVLIWSGWLLLVRNIYNFLGPWPCLLPKIIIQRFPAHRLFVCGISWSVSIGVSRNTANYASTFTALTCIDRQGPHKTGSPFLGRKRKMPCFLHSLYMLESWKYDIVRNKKKILWFKSNYMIDVLTAFLWRKEKCFIL